MKLIALEQAAVLRAIMPSERARAFEQTAFEVAAVLSLGVATGAFALRQALDELAVVDDAIFLPQGAATVIEAVAKCALVAHALLAIAALAVEAALAELPFETAAIGEAETPLAVEQAVTEFAFVAVAGGPQPESLTVPLAVLERALVAGAVGVVQPTLALQQPVDDGPAITPAVGQDSIGWRQRFAFTTGGEQAGEKKQVKQAHAVVRWAG